MTVNTVSPASSALGFTVPEGAVATAPPEARGVPRDGVRLLVASNDAVHHAHFSDIGRFLDPGDLLVVNTSATMAAAVAGLRGEGVGAGSPVTVHFSTALDDGSWLVELRPGRRATGPLRDVTAGERVALPGGGVLTTLAPYPDPHLLGSRIWRVEVSLPAGWVRQQGSVQQLLVRHGQPIAYSYVTDDWPLAAYQSVFARDPGSAEMPSAGRPFTSELVTSLVARGVLVATVTLHTGVSSLEKGEPPLPEWYRVPTRTAAVVNTVHQQGGRVVAVGTTVTRALETVADLAGQVHPGTGWTDLVLGPGRPARGVDGIITGWHEPGASHLSLLQAVAGPTVVARAYREAVRERYLWHEFGDSALLLPDPPDPLRCATRP